MGLLAIDVRRKIGFSCDLSECLGYSCILRHSQILPNIGHALQTILRLRLRYRIIPYIGWAGIKISGPTFFPVISMQQQPIQNFQVSA